MKTTDLHNQISVGVGIALTAVADGAMAVHMAEEYVEK